MTSYFQVEVHADFAFVEVLGVVGLVEVADDVDVEVTY